MYFLVQLVPHILIHGGEQHHCCVLVMCLLLHSFNKVQNPDLKLPKTYVVLHQNRFTACNFYLLWLFGLYFIFFSVGVHYANVCIDFVLLYFLLLFDSQEATSVSAGVLWLLHCITAFVRLVMEFPSIYTFLFFPMKKTELIVPGYLKKGCLSCNNFYHSSPPIYTAWVCCLLWTPWTLDHLSLAQTLLLPAFAGGL